MYADILGATEERNHPTDDSEGSHNDSQVQTALSFSCKPLVKVFRLNSITELQRLFLNNKNSNSI